MNHLHPDVLRTGIAIREAMIPMVITYEEREAVALHLDQTCRIAARWIREPAVGHGMTVVISADGELSVHDCIAPTDNE
jgi:hypothetical protein